MSGDDVDRLWDQGMEAVGQEDWEAAIAIGDHLLSLRHTSGFEIVALAREGLGDLEGAVATLEQGLEHAPKIWRFWQLLGNLRSELGDPKGARQAYDRALTCPKVWVGSIQLNRAVLAEREGRVDEALRLLEGLDEEEELWEHAAGLRLRIRCRQRGARDQKARYLRVVAHVPGKGETFPFYQAVDVVAVDTASALRFLVEDLGEDFAGATAEEVEDVQGAGDWPLGVQAVRGGRMSYDPAGEGGG